MIIKKIKNRIPVQIKATGAFAFASFLTKGIGFITIPIFTRLMPPEEIGVVTVFFSWYAIIGTFANLALDSGSFSVAMIEYKDNRDRYMSSILTLSSVNSILFIFLYLFFRTSVKQLTGLSELLIGIMLLSFIFMPATNLWMARQRYEYKYKASTLISMLQIVVSSVLSVAAVSTASKHGITQLGEVRLISNYLILILISMYFYVSILKKGKSLYSREYWSFALKINLPLLIHTLAKQVLDISDRTMIAAMVGNREAGIYGTLYSVSSLSLILWSAINASLIPYMFEKLQSGKNAEEINRVLNPMLIIYSLGCILLSLLAPEIVKIIATKAYYEAIYMMPPVVAGIFFTSFYNIFSNVLLYHKKTKKIMYSTLFSATVNVVLNYLFIPSFGYIAAAYTTLFTYMLLAIIHFWFVIKIQKQNPLFHNRLIWTIAAATTVLCLGSSLIYSFTAIRFCIIFIISIAGIILFYKYILKKEKKGKKCKGHY